MRFFLGFIPKRKRIKGICLMNASYNSKIKEKEIRVMIKKLIKALVNLCSTYQHTIRITVWCKR